MEVYTGNTTYCNTCKYRGEQCKAIDHDKLKLYTKLFGGYEESINKCTICNHFEPADWDNSAKQSWLGIEPYIDYLVNDFYQTKAGAGFDRMTLGKAGGVCLCIGATTDKPYGYIQYFIAGMDWIKGTWLIDNIIHYRNKYRIVYTPTGKIKSKEYIEGHSFDNLSEYLATGNTDYLLESV